MKIFHRKMVGQLFAPLAALVLVSGCVSGNYQKGAATGAELKTSAAKITQGESQIDAVTTSLNALVKNPGDLAAQFKNFSDAVNRLQSTAKEIDSKVAAMREKGDTYFAMWNQQIAQIQNEDIKNQSAARKAEMQKKFAAIQKSYQEAQNDFKPFMSDLKDIQMALSTDLTPGGVDAIKGTAGKVTKEAAPLKTTLDKLAGQFKDLGVAMSDSMPQPAPQ